jgi:hypothetical protein
MGNFHLMDWGTPQGVAMFFASLAILVASVGVLLWGVGQLI